MEIGLLFFKHFLKTEYLHYGLFSDGLEADISNLARAQQNYAEFLIAHIPTEVRTILDVGCGSGRFASELLARGYRVDCVSPGTTLTEHARGVLGDRARIFQAKFEDLDCDGRYDLILFSESFQYIPMHEAFAGALRRLNPGGHIMICDYFRTGAPGTSPLGGGHDLREFQELLQRLPICRVREHDITPETAPTLDLVNDVSMEVLLPIYNLVFLVLEDRVPLLVRFIRWKYREKLEKLQSKHFGGERNAANFVKYKTYRFYLLQATQ